MLDIESFLKGYKPALLYDTDSDQELRQLKEFPFVQIWLYKKDQHLYFRSEQLKQDFINRTKELVPDSPGYHREIGLALGFPPKAVDFYITTLLGKENDFDLLRIGIEYCGICFVTSIDSLIEDVSFLWENVNIPSSERTHTAIRYTLGSRDDPQFCIIFNDCDSLYQAYREINLLHK